MTPVGQLVWRYAWLTCAVVALNFGLPRLLPGDPLESFAPDGFGLAAPTLTVQARAQLRATYHLDEPLPAQFVAYLADLGHGDLGWSISRAAPVNQLIGERLPWTLGLVCTSVLVASLGGAAVGVLAAWRGGRTDRAVLAASTILAALPEFLIAMALLLALSVGLRWFPLQGGRTLFAASTGGGGGLATARDVAWHLTLPALTLVLATSAGFALLARGAVGGVRAEPYLTTARAKGLGELAVSIRHAVPNALLPVLTLFGVRLGQILGGALVVERVFAVPGLGLLTFEAIRARDYPVLQAIFLLGSLGILTANFAVELGYRWLGPRRVG
jgi:peptide/nickel transport system permease protein